MNGRWLMRVLWGMVVALLLAVASLATARSVGADAGSPPRPPQPTGCHIVQYCCEGRGPCHSCGYLKFERWRYKRYCDVCFDWCWPWERENLACGTCW